MIVLKNLTLRRGPKIVLQATSLTLNPGEKVGLVGRNGAGKSSLFALLTHRLQADAGDFSIPPRWRMAEVAQNMPETDQPATAFVLEGDTRLMEAQAALAAAEAADDGNAIGEAHGLLAEVGAFDASPRAQALMLGLGFKSAQLDAPVNSFSGGWRMRLQLARALMCPSDLLLLDEPTNHLDLDALVWLEAWLQRYEGTMLVISHDREFLDAITKVTVHLDEAQLMRYGGNYSAFEMMRAERMSQQQAAFGRQQDKVAQLQRFIDRFKAKASKAKQAQSRVKALERMEKIAPVLTSADFSFEFREPENLPNPMLAMRDMECGYMAPPVAEVGDAPPAGGGSGLGRPGAGAAEAGGRPIVIVRDINRSVMPGQRIGILGANGQGKSTLVKTLARALPALGGSVTEGKGLAIGYFAQQEMDVLTPDSGPMEHMIRLAKQVSPGAREQELRNFLGQFRFTGDMVHQPVGSLSGGEKARLVLAMIVWQRPNLLLLDEPTNHLDLTTREALSMALNEFEGTVMLVSHDRALLREVCDEFWLVTAGGVREFDGDLDDYQRWLLEQSREQARAYAQAARGAVAAPALVEAPAKPSKADEPVDRREDRKAQAQARQRAAEQARPLKAEFGKLEARLATAVPERDTLAASLADPSLSAAERAERGKRLKLLSEQIETFETRWLELGEAIEALSATA
ncbi:ABC-F family ATP-binding cassette domain-containing protein [Methylibium sp.]|uniref:ABC-F family ATP-binding cassette domain-containing protein n=1 Tax=Methylibium sp. TaxID=2067992 RepID=UPI003D111A97